MSPQRPNALLAPHALNALPGTGRGGHSAFKLQTLPRQMTLLAYPSPRASLDRGAIRRPLGRSDASSGGLRARLREMVANAVPTGSSLRILTGSTAILLVQKASGQRGTLSTVSWPGSGQLIVASDLINDISPSVRVLVCGIVVSRNCTCCGVPRILITGAAASFVIHFRASIPKGESTN